MNILLIMKLKVELDKGDVFVRCFQHMKTFTESINITFNYDHMYVQCMDTSMILIMELKIPALWFDAYKVDQPITIGLMTSLWSKVLSIRADTQTIYLNTEDCEDHLSVLFKGEQSKSSFDKSFEVPLVSIDRGLLNISEMEFSAEFSLPSTTFGSMVNQLKQFGDNLFIECTEEHIQLIADSQEFGKMKTHIPIEELEEYAIDEGQIVTSSFGLRMLHNICLYQKIAKNINIGLTANYPMKIEYNIEDNAELVFYIAPRIED
jgi:proliferating cell nuclear antigen PCNA